MSSRFVFVERDGGILRPVSSEDAGGLAAVRLADGVIAALKRFGDAGYAVVLLAGRAAADDDKDRFVDELLASQGIAVAASLRCEHDDAAGCDCALPGIGLVESYVADPKLDRAGSIVVGRADRALGLARAMGLSGFDVASSTTWSEIAHTVLDKPRRATVTRKTKETEIRIDVDLDESRDPSISTGIGFFDHMLEQLGKHGGFALDIACTGDLDVDEHHTVEDVALALGQALKEALGDKRGIGRYGFMLPMDEAQVQVAVDLSGRAFLVFDGTFPRENVGGLPTELVEHFFRSLADTLGASLQVSVRGDNAHHMVEACFKGVARTLRQAFARAGTELPSTKGTL